MTKTPQAALAIGTENPTRFTLANRGRLALHAAGADPAECDEFQRTVLEADDDAEALALAAQWITIL